jgi:superfamily II DNA or RNA helicase
MARKRRNQLDLDALDDEAFRTHVEQVISKTTARRLDSQAIERLLGELGLSHLVDADARRLAYALGMHSSSWGTLRHELTFGVQSHSTRQLLRQLPAAVREQRRRVARQLADLHAAELSPALRELADRLLADVATMPLPFPDPQFVELQQFPLCLFDSSRYVTLPLEPDLPPDPTDDVRGLKLALLSVLTNPELAEQRETIDRYLSASPAQRALDELVARIGSQPDSREEGALGWMLKERGERLTLVPVLATPKRRGDGYKVKEYDPAKHGEVPFTPADQRADGRSTLVGVLDELVGHERVFVKEGRRCDGRPRRVRRAEVIVRMASADEGVTLALEIGGEPVAPQAFFGPTRIHDDWLLHVTDDSLFVVWVSHEVATLAAMASARGGRLVVPDGASLLQKLPTMADTSLRVDPGALGQTVLGDPKPVVRMFFTAGQLEVVARVQPLPEAPSQPPGRGSEVLVAHRDDQPVFVQRALSREVEHVRRALVPLELPESSRVDEGPDAGFHWQIDDLQVALEVVDRARRHAGSLQLAWGGQRPSLAERPVRADQLRMRVSSGRDWFGVQGEATVDGQSVAVSALLAAAREGHAWVPLSSGGWARLSDDLRSTLAAAASAAQGKQHDRLQAIHAPLLQELVDEGAELDAPPAWLSLADRCREAAGMEVELPAVRATLRPYQAEGVRWLLRLAHWAPGAVLADDMGLGKTLQTLAVLLARSDRPSLVVAPTSLVHNWHREAEKFTPGLSVSVYHGSGRQLDAGPGKVVLTTYGVLVNDIDTLAEVGFGTVVFDEAHALKNPTARRSKAARRLDAGFVVALTGTPVENRTLDLWSLMSVTVPGLLGTATDFRGRFVVPIEGQGDTTARRTLAHLVGPFVLRRTKAQVATDLPARTEIVREVQLSAAERTLYDRTRLASLTRIEQAGERATFQVLEELLRLRKLACHPRLFDASSTVQSSKLQQIRRVVADLVESGQKVLLFSTFTTHLALIREALQADGFALRYLDGRMGPKARQAEVDAFQGGDGDVFLISTKAGGVGLNLTAATAVLHVDPWWNPAAEDQATDRAHRIGQDRPVTVVRFVAAGTIEEQIVALHATKRDLADALLSQSGSTKQLSAEELRLLLAGDVPAPPPTSVEIPEPEPEPDPEPEPEPEPAPVPPATPPSDPVAAFVAHLQGLHERGEIGRKATVRSYARAVEHFVQWLPDEQPVDAETVQQQRDAFLQAARADDYPHRSDKVYASPALNRLADWLLER